MYISGAAGDGVESHGVLLCGVELLGAIGHVLAGRLQCTVGPTVIFGVAVVAAVAVSSGSGVRDDCCRRGPGLAAVGIHGVAGQQEGTQATRGDMGESSTTKGGRVADLEASLMGCRASKHVLVCLGGDRCDVQSEMGRNARRSAVCNDWLQSHVVDHVDVEGREGGKRQQEAAVRREGGHWHAGREKSVQRRAEIRDVGVVPREVGQLRVEGMEEGVDVRLGEDAMVEEHLGDDAVGGDEGQAGDWVAQVVHIGGAYGGKDQFTELGGGGAVGLVVEQGVLVLLADCRSGSRVQDAGIDVDGTRLWDGGIAVDGLPHDIRAGEVKATPLAVRSAESACCGSNAFLPPSQRLAWVVMQSWCDRRND